MLNNYILAVIVLYKQHINESSSLKTLSQSLAEHDEVIDLVVYDNSPTFSTGINNFQYNKNLKIVKYIPDKNNSGVSRAYNAANNIAKSLGKKYLLLLDQDTSFSLNFVKELAANIKAGYDLLFPFLRSSENIISPCNYILGRGSYLPVNRQFSGIHNIRKTNFLNSGAVISISLFNTTGGYDERIPLYFSDFNFFNRAKRHCKTYYVLNSFCEHSMASNDLSDTDKFLYRYKDYCEGGILCYDSLIGRSLMIINIIARSLKLSIKMKSLATMKIAIETIYDKTAK